MVEFAGWEMPVQYEGVRAEHVAVRTAAGLFDVSHMGQIETRGPGAEAFLRGLLSNDIGRTSAGGAQYSLLCNEEGGILDDLFTYRFEEDRDGDGRFLSVVNASNARADFGWFHAQAERHSGVEVADRSDEFAMLALQGPLAPGLLGPLLDGEPPKRFRFSESEVAGVRCLVCRTGYTGEDGFELLVPPDETERVWEVLLRAGAVPAGLAARDTLRLEVCYPLHGSDISPDRTPIEAGLRWACDLEHDFIGAEVLREQAERGTPERLVPFVLTERGVPRAGCAVLCGGKHAGTVTSGTFSPCLEVGIGMAYVRSELAEPGTELEIDVRGRRRGARVDSKPIYEKEQPAHGG